MSTGRWRLVRADGAELGVFEGASPGEAIHAMFRDMLAWATFGGGPLDAATLDTLASRLVPFWSGRAICIGSVPAMPAVTVPEVVVPSLDGCPDTERGQ